MLKDDDTGIVVSPPTAGKPGGKRKGTEGTNQGSRAGRGRSLAFTAAWMLLATGVGAGAVYFAMHERLELVNRHLADVNEQAGRAGEEVARARAQLTAATGELQVARAHREQAETELTTSKAAAERAIADKASEAQELEHKLASVLAGQGEVSQSGGAVRLELVDKVLFAVGQSELTERGKQVLGKVGGALLEASDKQIWVQGHTDDLPITPDKGVKPTFPSNWELAAARALTVVHYLQDVSKIEPQRLAAVAFGQYRPISRTRAKNRRIEIVLYPKIDVRPR